MFGFREAQHIESSGIAGASHRGMGGLFGAEVRRNGRAELEAHFADRLAEGV